MNRAIVNMGHSARERFKAIAKESGRDANYVFQRYAFERFYYRLGKSPYADRFILKGAALFSLWMDNSRLKDYFDIWALSANCQFDLELLRTAVARTFKRNGIELGDEWPTGLTNKFADNPIKNSQWLAFVRKTQPIAKPESLKEAVACIRRFLEPVVFTESVDSATWSPEQGRWRREGKTGEL